MAAARIRVRRIGLLDHDALTHLDRVDEAVDRELALLPELVLEGALPRLGLRAEAAVEIRDRVLVLRVPGPLDDGPLRHGELALREVVVLQRGVLARGCGRRDCG